MSGNVVSLQLFKTRKGSSSGRRSNGFARSRPSEAGQGIADFGSWDCLKSLEAENVELRSRTAELALQVEAFREWIHGKRVSMGG